MTRDEARTIVEAVERYMTRTPMPPEALDRGTVSTLCSTLRWALDEIEREREACAKECEAMAEEREVKGFTLSPHAARTCAARIRGRR